MKADLFQPEQEGVESMAYIAIVGGANVDIGGFPEGRALAGDSNPGRVRVSMGGVGRNIACNAARMGLEVELITALGGDAHADLIRADCARAGVSLAHALCFPDAATSSYLFIADEHGDMALAVNDMGIHDRLTVEALAPALDVLRGASLVVLDANVPARTIAWLAQTLEAPVIADAVSAAKADKLSAAIPYLDALKPNRIEAQLLTGISVETAGGASRAARALVERGAKRVFLTLGAQGVCCADARETRFLSGGHPQVVNATGAGDAFTAALAWARLRNLPLSESALAGMAAATIAMESMETVNPEMSPERLVQRMAELRG